MRGLVLSVAVGIAAASVLGASGCCAGSCLRSRTIRQAARRQDDAQLRAWLADPRSWVREEAARAAGAHGRRGLRSDLEGRLADVQERRWVRAAAAEALGQIGGDADSLLAIANDPAAPPSVKIALIEAVCRLDPATGASRLAPLRDDPDVLVSAVAQKKVSGQCAVSE